MCKSSRFGINFWAEQEMLMSMTTLVAGDDSRGPSLVISAFLPNRKTHITSALVFPCYTHAAFQLLCRTLSGVA